MMSHSQKQLKYTSYSAPEPISPGAMGRFLLDIHLEPNSAMEVKTVKFHEEADAIQNTGLVELLKDHVKKGTSTLLPPFLISNNTQLLN